jgi:catechol 2,3-dioxygenase-like lactoylglutathione lyase family enzyme
VTLRPRRVLETAVYCDDLSRTTDFYRDLLARDPMLSVERVVAFDAGEGTVLLLFQRGASDHAFHTSGGVVPGHTSTGPAHIAFAIDKADVPTWLKRLETLHIAIESRVDWPRGGHSIYFRDSDGRSVELATPGTWASY